jgi:peptide/nickel transport system substrate-binding protein
MKTKSLFTLLILVAVVAMGMPTVMTAAQGGERVPKVEVLSDTQGEDPIEYEMTRVVVDNMRKLGLDVEQNAVPWATYSDIVWYQRDNWQMTAWRMVGRPERMDPDEFVVNLFSSSTAESGYNFVGYINPEYDALAQEQRGQTDREQRRATIFKAQELIARDVPYVYVANPTLPQLVRTDVWDEASIVDQQGIGIQNFWTWTGLTPLGDQKSIITDSPSTVISINPFYISGDIDSRITELIWDRLERLGPDGLPEPWAAESVTWEDNLNVVVKLRPGMKWHDGVPVTAEDVKFSFEAPQGDEVPMYAKFVSGIANIEILDDLTVRFTLSEPWVAFETASLAKLNLVPKHIWEPILAGLAGSDDNAEDIQEDVPIGSGPYKFVAWEPGEQVILEANQDYFAPPKADKWVLRIIPNAEAILGQIQTGELNFVREWPGDSQVLQEVADSDPNIKLYASPELGFRFFGFNLRTKPFDDVALRQAVAHAVPRDAIIANIFKGFAVPADSYISVAIDYWHDPNLPQYDYNIEEARQILADAGYTWDSDGPLLYPAE